MGLIQLIKIDGALIKARSIAKEKATMNTKVAQYITLAISLAGTLGVPTLAANWLHAHLIVYTVFVAAAIVLHALFPSIFAAPSAAVKQAAGLGNVGVILLFITLSMLFARPVHAQAATLSTTTTATTSTSTGFAAASEAVAVNYGGTWSAGTHVTEDYDFLDFGATKANHLYLEGHELLAPTPGFSIYAGGLKYQPNLAGLLSKTNVPASSFSIFLQAAAGNGVPSSGGSHISFLAGGGVKYQITSSLTWQTLDAQWMRYGSSNGAAISTGLSFLFGK